MSDKDLVTEAVDWICTVGSIVKDGVTEKEIEKRLEMLLSQSRAQAVQWIAEEIGQWIDIRDTASDRVNFDNGVIVGLKLAKRSLKQGSRVEAVVGDPIKAARAILDSEDRVGYGA